MKYQTTRKERWSYWSYFIGQNLIYWLVTNYLLLYYTDYLYLPAMTVSLLILIAKVWDAVNDPLFGIIVDKVHFRKGKFIPWIRWGTFLLPVVTFLMFASGSDKPLGIRIAIAALSYFVYDFLYTVSDVPIYALSTVMTENIEERNKIISYARLAASLGGLIISLAVAPMIERMGFLVPALVIMGAAYITMLPVCRFAKERVNKEQKKEGGSFKEFLSYLKGNKPLVLIFTAIAVYGIFNINLGLYIAKYCLGSLDYVTMTAIVTLLPGASVFLLVPLFLKKIDKIKLYRIALIATIISGGIAYFVGYQNIPAYMVMAAVKAFFGSITSLLMFTFAPDCVEYGQFMTGLRKEGITFSLQTFTAKFTAAISAAVSGFVLTIMHYDGKLTVQPAEILNQFWIYSNWIPVIGAILSLPLFYGYKLKDKKIQIMADCNAGKISREEAEKRLKNL